MYIHINVCTMHMYVCMYVCMYVSMMYVYTCGFMFVCTMYVCTMYACMYVSCTYVAMYVWSYRWVSM